MTARAGAAARSRAAAAPTLLLALPPLLFVLVFFVYPVASILALGLAPGGVPDVAGVIATLSQPFVREVAWFTLWQAVVSTVLTVVLALPAACVVARFEFPGKRLVEALSIVPFVLPTVVVASAFLALLGPRGPFVHTIWAILAAHVFYNLAIVLRLVGGAWRQVDPPLVDAARMLGASRWRAFAEVTWPLLRPAVASASSIVFLFTFTSFGVILLLGGPRFATLEVEIYRQTAQLLDLPVAATLALLQLAALLLLLLAYARTQERFAVQLRAVGNAATARRPRTAREWLLVAGCLAGLGVLLGLPLAALVGRSVVTADGIGLGHYASLLRGEDQPALFVPPLEAVANSLLFAVGASALCVVLGLLASVVIARRRGALGQSFDALLMLPLGTSAVIVGFGFIVAFGRPIVPLPFDLRTSPLLIPLAHALVALPFVVRAVVPVLRSIDGRLREAAATLGASPARAWREIDLPIVGRALLVGAGFAFAVSLGEFGATLFIARPDTPTLPVAIFRLLAQPGGQVFGQAMAMSVVLMAVTAAAMLAIDRFRGGTVGQL